MFLITKIDFDTYENSISQAITMKYIGYCETEELANEFINSSNHNKYSGWDNKEYPKFKIIKLDKLEITYNPQKISMLNRIIRTFRYILFQ